MFGKWFLLCLGFLLLLLLSACGTNRYGASDGKTQSQSSSYSNLANSYHPDGTIAESVHTNKSLQPSQVTAEEITAMVEVNSSYVVITDSNAYVAIVPEDGPDTGIAGKGNRVNRQSNFDNNSLPTPLKDLITIKVRALNPNVKDVYITADPGFVRWMKAFDGQMRQGKSGERLVRQFNVMVTRLFPASTTRGYNSTPHIPVPIY